MNIFKNGKDKFIKNSLFFFVIEGLISLGFYLQNYSSEKNSFFLGLSKERLIIGALFLLLLFLILMTGIVIKKQDNRFRHIGTRIIHFITDKRRINYFRLFIIFYCSIVISLILVTSQFLGFSGNPEILTIVIQRLLPFLLWLLLVSGHILYILSDGENKSTFFQMVLWTVIILFWVLFTIVFLLRDRQPFLFQNLAIAYRTNETSSLKLLIVSIWLFLWIGYLFLLSKNKINKAILVILPILLFLMGVFVLPYSSGGLFESWKARYLLEPQNHIVYSVCYESYGVDKTLRNYDLLYNTDFWLGTKPPGYFLFYSALNSIGKLFFPSSASCEMVIASIGVVLFPIMAGCNIFFVILLGKKLRISSPIFAGIVAATIPNILFYCFSPDQFLFPFLFNLTLLFLIFPDNKYISIIGGFLIYISIFISFSLLPIIGFLLIWQFIGFLNHHDKKSLLNIIKQWIFISFGLITAFLVMSLIFGYNPIVRYQNAFVNHRTIKDFSFAALPFIKSIFLNNFEFAISIGLPAFIIFISEILRSISRWLKKQASQLDLLNLAIMSTFILLNLFGQTVGEVGRLWIFFVTFISLTVGQALYRYFHENKYSLYMIIIMQLLSTLVLFYVF